jgi:chitinase
MLLIILQTSELHCVNLDPVNLTQPCQQGFGQCRVMPSPSCGDAVSTTPTASKGRKIAYYQAGYVSQPPSVFPALTYHSNVRYRQCNRISPSQIDTTGITHLFFAFASIDPVTFKIVPSDPDDLALYPQFTSLKSSKLETWIAVGGFGFNDKGPTFTTWSDMCSTPSNRAAFIGSLIEFMDKWGFQGMDIDWEFPAVADRGGKDIDTWNLVLLVREMRAVFGSKYGISIAL